MPSPFPGMNPFLVQNDAWEDFHHSYIDGIRAILVGGVGPNYIVKIETKLFIRELRPEERWLMGRADVSVSSLPGTTSTATAAVAECPAPPRELRLPNVDRERYTWIEIIDRRSRRIVTALELLSPTNKKAGPDRDEYLDKRSYFRHGRANFVEIDLRRGGTRPYPPEIPPCDYYALVIRKEDWPRVGFWPLSIRDRLPVIPVPLHAPDPDIVLDLQAVLHRVYDAADYGKYIYSETPEPPLPPDDAAWATQLIPSGQPH